MSEKSRKIYNKEYRLLNNSKLKKKQKIKDKEYPWKRRLKIIKQRCSNPNNISYKYYGGRGIKCLITEEELKTLWLRDKANKMKFPTVNRIENNKHYTFCNCEFIERALNVSEMNIRTKSYVVIQYNLKNKFIKQWDSIGEAGIAMNRSKTSICNALKGKTKTCNNFIWRYKNEK